MYPKNYIKQGLYTLSHIHTHTHTHNGEEMSWLYARKEKKETGSYSCTAVISATESLKNPATQSNHTRMYRRMHAHVNTMAG